MTKQIKTPDGVIHAFPDDATDAEISATLNAPAARPPSVGRPRQSLGMPKQDDWLTRNVLRPIGAVVVDPETGEYRAGQSPFESTGRPIAEGMSLGLFDEAEGLGAAVGGKIRQLYKPPGIKEEISGAPRTWQELYNAGVEESRSRSRGIHEKHPVIAGALNLIGSLAAGGPAAGAVKTAPMTLGEATKAGAKIGATYGGVAGFGSGEGGFMNRIASSAVGAATGGTVGAALPSLLFVGGKLVQATKNALNLGSPEIRAQVKILQALERDGMTPSEAMGRYMRWQAGGQKPEALMDLGGENMRRLARDVVSVPGKSAQAAETFLTERQAGQGERIMKDVGKALPDEQFYNTVDDLVATRAESAAPIYNEAYRAAGEVWNPDLARLASRPSMKQAWARAQQLAAEQNRPLPNVFKEGATEGLENVPGKVPTLEAWDYMKQGLDDILETYRDKTTGKLVLDKLGRAVDQTRRELLTALDAQVEKNVGAPIYATARNQWAGPSQSLDALAMGRDVFNKDAEVTAKQIAGMTDSEKQFFRIGAVRAIKDRVDRAKDGADALKQFWNSPGWRAKLEATFPSKAEFERFRFLMEREANMFASAAAARTGSRTASVEAGQADLMTDPSFLDNIFSGNWLQAAKQGGSAILRRGQGMSSDVSDQLADILFNPSSASVQETLRGLSGRAAERAASLARAQSRTSMATRGGAGLLGRGAGMITSSSPEESRP